MIKIEIQGLEQLKRTLGAVGKQVPFAASKALNTTAFAVNAEVKKRMSNVFEGGAGAYTLRAFGVERASKQNLTATVALRTDAPAGGTPYDKALRHLFTSGTRDWKKLEGYLLGRGLMPAGLIAVPGKSCPLDRRGNMKKDALKEMLGGLGGGSRGMRVYRKTGGGKAIKAVGYFVAMPGNTARLKPGIYKRVETGSTSGLQPMVMFVRRGNWRQFIDLKAIGNEVVGKTFAAEFSKEFADALATAR